MRKITTFLALFALLLMNVQSSESMNLFDSDATQPYIDQTGTSSNLDLLSTAANTGITNALVASDELRGTWLAWSGGSDNVPSNAEIVSIMSDLASAGINTVCVPTWRFGYTYFQSEVFHSHTGLYTDPGLSSGRDVLAEMVTAGHNSGLKVVAWFEYGFAGALGTSSPMWMAHSDWFAEQEDGNQVFENETRWFIHTHPEVHEFLIEISREVLEKYDVDGIQMDRIRYPDLDCGYDDFTKSLYLDENGVFPPSDSGDATWQAWRADKLTEFVGRYYNEMKAIEPNIPVSNAPITYPFGYDNFCQDWPAWVNSNYLDFVIPQVYRADNTAYSSELDNQLSYVTDDSKVYPGITAIYNGSQKSSSEIADEVTTTRNRGQDGHVLWFHDEIMDDLTALKAQVYSQNANLPALADYTGFTHSCVSEPGIVIEAEDATQNGSWVFSTSQAGYLGSGYYHDNNDEKGSKNIVFAPTITQSGSYEVFVIHTVFSNRATNVPVDIQHFDGTSTASVDQQMDHGVWVSIGTYDFAAGGDNKVTLRTDGTSQFVIADAVRFTFRECKTLSILPVELSDFTGKLIGRTTMLNWLTGSETNNSAFEIERSLDGKTFQQIGSVTGHGTTQEPQSYEFVDPSPRAGKNYYRLKQIDFDGSYVYSNIVFVTIAGVKDVKVLAYPSPSSDIITIESDRIMEEIQVWNIAGKLIQTLQVQSQTIDLDISAFKTGDYYARVYTGQKVEIVRFVKK